MDLLESLQLGLATALTLENLFYCLLGVSVGMIVGVLPGIGHLAAVSLLMPLTFHVPATAALVMLAGIYYGAQYGGSIASILLNLPGTASSAVICLDGYPMAQKGRAGSALMITTIASFFGSCFAILVLILMAPPLAQLALSFHSADYFSMMVLGLVAAGSISQGRPLLGLASVVLGLLIGLVGIDVNSGVMRMTFGVPELFDGISIIVIAMALFGVSEVISSIGKTGGSARSINVSFRSLLPTRKEWSQSGWPILRGSGVGTAIGILPGTGGGSMASFMAYAVEKRVSSKPESFGKGAVPGIAAPEGANNAAAQSSFIPTLTLGIPGDAIMALMLGALMIHGIAPGPRVVTDNPELFWGLIVSFLIGNLILLILNIPLIKVWVKILQIPYRLLFPAIILLICAGVYSLDRSAVDVLMVAGFSAVGYLLIKLGFEAAPLLLGFILGPMLEENLRRSMLLSRGDFMVFLERPVSATFLILSALLLLWVIWGTLKPRQRPVVNV
ncbi:tripartite tricarboxylate transporter permease [Halomonas sp. JS92-SW72]|uniref:tripartite tricarboxylate transporter permease n=1 Tax=Halomonas sp. JS92-SW72 TaxID=2306583 RepID=UPI000E5B0296|nr:tripartite tricarboxylate transporter permease [Halomonas sp. JS92-SW72]AXY43776.1 tripartite tricarboxylate transporter permease [Halomonas sp. JS92-SW72]